MCILFIFINTKPKVGSYRLVIASNRDEFYHRPAAVARFYPDDNIIAGKDMEKNREGGTWLGVSLKKSDNFKFRFGALLNLTGEDRKKDAKGRGFIVMDYIKDTFTAKEYIEQLKADETHNAYNFVVVEMSDDSASTFHHSNSPSKSTEFKGSQILSFGNSPSDFPLSKVKEGKLRFQEIVSKYDSTESKDLLINELICLLKWKKRHLPDPELQRRSPNAFEQLSSIFVEVENTYGTRTHSIILVDEKWNVDFIEDTMQEPCSSETPWTKQIITSSL